MSARTANLVFRIAVAVWAAMFVALVVEAHRDVADDIAVAGRVHASAAAGRRVYERHHCGACHAVLAVGAGYAPDLTRAWQRIGGDAIRARLGNAHRDGAARKMPAKSLAPREIEDVVAYLGWVARVDSRERPRTFTPERIAAALRRVAPSPDPGAVLVAKHGCLDCHAVGDRGGDRAPRLEEIAARDDAAFVDEYLMDPARFAPRTPMPRFAAIPLAERRAMGKFVASLVR